MWPDYQAYIIQSWGYPMFDGCWNTLGGASNVVVGTNPPYSITDFYGFFPKFAGLTVVLNGTFAASSALVTNIDATGLATGQYVSTIVPSPAIPSGTSIQQVNAVGSGGNGEITLTQPSSQTGVFPLTVYVGPPLVPIQVIMAYLNLASASLVQARWLDTWVYGMALYTAHFLSLYLRSEGNCSSTCGQAATAGLKSGITIGISAGGVSQTLKPVPGIDDWGMWGQSSYGSQLVQFAKSIGAGPVLLYSSLENVPEIMGKCLNRAPKPWIIHHPNAN